MDESAHPPLEIARLDILIVDDNAYMRLLIRSILQAVGARRLREAGDAQDALDMLAHQPAHLILLDQAMPGMSGLDFLRALRANTASPSTKARVIMVTGYGERRHVAAARDAGADEFLVKPISTRALLQRIESVIRRGRDFVEVDNFQGPDRRRRDASTPAEGDRRAGSQQLI